MGCIYRWTPAKESIPLGQGAGEEGTGRRIVEGVVAILSLGIAVCKEDISSPPKCWSIRMLVSIFQRQVLIFKGTHWDSAGWTVITWCRHPNPTESSQRSNRVEVEKTDYLWHLLENKTDFIQRDYGHWHRDHCHGVCSRMQALGSTPNTARQRGIL